MQEQEVEIKDLEAANYLINVLQQKKKKAKRSFLEKDMLTIINLFTFLGPVLFSALPAIRKGLLF